MHWRFSTVFYIRFESFLVFPISQMSLSIACYFSFLTSMRIWLMTWFLSKCSWSRLPGSEIELNFWKRLFCLSESWLISWLSNFFPFLNTCTSSASFWLESTIISHFAEHSCYFSGGPCPICSSPSWSIRSECHGHQCMKCHRFMCLELCDPQIMMERLFWSEYNKFGFCMGCGVLSKIIGQGFPMLWCGLACAWLWCLQVSIT